MQLLKHLTSSPPRTSASPAEARAVANVAWAVFKRKQWCVEHIVLRSVSGGSHSWRSRVKHLGGRWCGWKYVLNASIQAECHSLCFGRLEQQLLTPASVENFRIHCVTACLKQSLLIGQHLWHTHQTRARCTRVQTNMSFTTETLVKL